MVWEVVGNIVFFVVKVVGVKNVLVLLIYGWMGVVLSGLGVV